MTEIERRLKRVKDINMEPVLIHQNRENEFKNANENSKLSKLFNCNILYICSFLSFMWCNMVSHQPKDKVNHIKKCAASDSRFYEPHYCKCCIFI